jgi:hypothetical protein
MAWVAAGLLIVRAVVAFIDDAMRTWFGLAGQTVPELR